jgi:hypothetical protein
VGDNSTERGDGSSAQIDTQAQAWPTIIMMALLRSLRWASLLGVVLTSAALHALIVYSVASISRISAMLLCIVVGLLGVYVAIRIEFDARLLDRLVHADRTQWRAFDAAMMRLGLLSSDQVGRSLAERLRGMRRLARLQIALLALQAVLLLVAAI